MACDPVGVIVTVGMLFTVMFNELEVAVEVVVQLRLEVKTQVITSP